MASTLLLDASTWDLVLDVNGNVAAAAEPYSLAQDAASAIKTFQGEVYFDTSIGVPYLQRILAKSPSLSTLKSLLETAARTVPGVAAAKVFVSSFSDRSIAGQVQVTSTAGQTSTAAFSVINPQAA